jgi:RNA polymerase sigma-70 factor, ECF subfamily
MNAKRAVAGLEAGDVSRVRAVLYLNGLRGEEIEDALQEIHLRVVERPPAVAGSLRSWACRVATHLALDSHRRARRRARAEGRLRALREASPEAADLELKEAVRQGLGGLAPQLRAIVVLRFYAELTVPQIAAALEMPEGTVKSQLHRAVAQLRDSLPKEVRAS